MRCRSVIRATALCDAVVDGLEERDRLGDLSLIAPEAGQIDGRAQLIEFGSLLPGNAESGLQVLFCGFSIPVHVRQRSVQTF